MRAQDIMHPEDAKAIQAIKSVPGCEGLARKLMKLGGEMQCKGENMANMMQVTSRNFPDIYASFKEVVNRVGIKEPDLYICNDPMMDAYTYGETHTFIVLSSGLIEKMSREELKGVIAHECGHILCKHTLYLTMYRMLENMGALLGLIQRTLFAPLYFALLYWKRKGELSADRCGAVVVGEEIYQAVLEKLASGMKNVSGQPYRLVEQGKEYEAFKRASLLNRLQQECSCIFYSHPQLCTRALELDRWRMSYAYRSQRIA